MSNDNCSFSYIFHTFFFCKKAHTYVNQEKYLDGKIKQKKPNYLKGSN